MNLNNRQVAALQPLLLKRTDLEAQIIQTCRAYLVSADIDPDRWTGQLDRDANDTVTLVLKEPEPDAAP